MFKQLNLIMPGTLKLQPTGGKYQNNISHIGATN